MNHTFKDTDTFIKEVEDIIKLYKDFPIVKENFNELGFYDIKKLGNIDKILNEFNKLENFNVEDLIDLYESLNISDRNLNDFFTPKSASQLISKMIKVDNNLEDKETINIYDPSIGIGRLVYYTFMELKDLYPSKNINIYGFDIYSKYVVFTQSILDLINFNRNKIDKANTLETNVLVIENREISKEDSIKSDIYFPHIDIVVSNPPYDKKRIENKFISHIMNLKPDRALIILPTSFSSINQSKNLRKKILENKLLKTVIGLPDNLFLNTNISTDLIELEKVESDKGTFMINGRNEDLYYKEGRKNIINIDKVIDSYKPVYKYEDKTFEDKQEFIKYLDNNEIFPFNKHFQNEKKEELKSINLLENRRKIQDLMNQIYNSGIMCGYEPNKDPNNNSVDNETEIVA